MSLISATLDALHEARANHEAVLVAYSGGKGSLATMELCSKVFDKIIAFHMFFVPGLQVIQKQLDFAKDRWGVETIQVPHWTLIKSYRTGLYCDPGTVFQGVPDYNLPHIHAMLAMDTGIKLVAHGGKAKDGLWRKWTFNQHKNKPYDMLYPLKEWTKYDVLAYLKSQNIPLPDSTGGVSSGVGLNTETLLWLWDNHREDFYKIEKWFPYVRAVVWRREWYGIGKV